MAISRGDVRFKETVSLLKNALHVATGDGERQQTYELFIRQLLVDSNKAIKIKELMSLRLSSSLQGPFVLFFFTIP